MKILLNVIKVVKIILNKKFKQHSIHEIALKTILQFRKYRNIESCVKNFETEFFFKLHLQP